MSGRLAIVGGEAKPKRGGCVIARAKTASVVGVYGEYMAATSCVEQIAKVADHMRKYGL